MKETRVLTINHIIWLSILLFYVLSVIAPYIFPIESRMGGILLIALLALIFALGLMKDNLKVTVHFTLYHTILLCFSLFCMLSSVWALDKSLAMSRSMDLIEICVGMFAIYYCIEKENDAPENLLKCIMWSGYILAVYSLIAYGWSGIVTVLSNSDRLSNDIINANVLGMSAAYSLLINFSFIIHRKVKMIWAPFAMISLIILIGSGSRKGILILILGIGMLLICKNSGNKNVIRNVLKVGFAILIGIGVLFILMRLHIFSGIEERMLGLFAGLSGHGVVDYSTMVRLRLVSIGKDVFRENPLKGIGINNSVVIVEQVLGRSNYYLHNNYIELLADIGIIGTAIYYSIYVFVLIRLLKYRRFSNSNFDICFSMLVIYLIMDYGAVTYNNKYSYIILMYFWLAAEKNKKEWLSERESMQRGRNDI